MASILSRMFNQKPKQQNNQLQSQLQALKQQGPSSAVFNQMYNSNPAFRQFADQVRNKTPEEAFKQYGLDFNNFKGLKW